MMTDAAGAASSPRPTVSVVVPFLGDEAAGRDLIAGLARLRLRRGDELILADNTPDRVASRVVRGDEVMVVSAAGERSSYHARNVGAECASGEWLLFTDADCRPEPDLLDAFFRRPVGRSTAILAGVVRAAEGRTLLTEWAASREILSQETAARADRPAGATACLLVRRSAWAAVGGFQEGVRSGADLEFCWRVVDQGLGLELRPEAGVEHLHRRRLRGIVRQMARYAAGNAWQERRSPGSSPRPRSLGPLARAVGGAVWFGVTLRPRRALLKLVDGVAVISQALGWGFSNSVIPAPSRSSNGPVEDQRLVVATDRFPVPSETFVISEIEALRSLGWRVRLEAVERPARPLLAGAHGLQVHYLEDEGAFGRAVATAWLLTRHPLRCAADRLRASQWGDERLPLSAIAPQARRLARGGEPHVHVHFAALSSVNALRAGALVGVPVSFIGHGHEIFVTPHALREKIEAASFAAGPCEYTTRYLRGLAPPKAESRVHTIVMGVDGERFRRNRPYSAGRSVVAVGRLVEKKGFTFLVDAIERLEASRPVDRLRIAGDGPLRTALEQRIAAAGLSDRIELLGALEGSEVRALLEEADVVAVPCVVASNGDRDAMPVVAKEALAMEVPVVATREVGLPELIQDGWGRLVPPGDPAALAEALDELLALPPASRAALGSAGRAFVVEHFSVDLQAQRLAKLIASRPRDQTIGVR